VQAEGPEFGAPPIDSTAPEALTFGEKNSQRLQIFAGVGQELGEDENEFLQIGVGYSWFVARDFSADFEAHLMHFDQVGEDAWGANVNFLLRWHFIHCRNWSLYLDGGAGLLFTTDDVPERGSSANFTPLAGAGLSLDLGGDARLLTGARWHHISNARTDAANPARDSVQLYAGISVPF
jgi:hypothetical protein